MNLLHLRYFAALAETENATETAAQLGISRSNLSMSVKKLETELGVSLFEKAGRGLRLSEDGRGFYKLLKEPLAGLDLAIRETQQRDDIAVMVGLPVMWSEPITEFAVRRPDIRLRTRQVSPRQVERFFTEYNFDFWLTGTDVEKYAHFLDVQKLYSTSIKLAVHKEHPLAKRESVSLWELSEESFLFPTNEYTLQNTYAKMCRESGFEPKISAYAIFDDRIKSVARGEGVTFMDYSETDGNVFRNIALLKVNDMPPRNYYVCSLKGRSPTPNAKAFLSFLKGYYG